MNSNGNVFLRILRSNIIGKGGKRERGMVEFEDLQITYFWHLAKKSQKTFKLFSGSNKD